MNSVLWTSLISSLQTGHCILVLGPEVCSSFDLSRSQAARPEETLVQGPEVSASHANSDSSPATCEENLRDVFCQSLAQKLTDAGHAVEEQSLFAMAQQFQDSPLLGGLGIRNIAAQFFMDSDFSPGKAHQELAKLPFSLILTTCHDDHMYRALLGAGKEPTSYRYHFNGEPRENDVLIAGHSPEKPAIYHLFGDARVPSSLVLTENDLLDFIIRVVTGRPKLPDSLRAALRNQTLLFIGFGIAQWYIRVLLKLLLRALDLSATSFALEPADQMQVSEWQQTILFYRRGSRIEVIEDDITRFLKECRSLLAKAGNQRRQTSRIGKRPQVFVSYERTDSELARELSDALPNQDFDVFIDRQLQVGAEWNAEIENKLRTCDYFVILNSQNLVSKFVGYVNKEINIALDEQKYRQTGTKFILPMVVTPLSANDGLADLRSYEQISLSRATVADDSRVLASTILRDFQRQRRGRPG